MDEKPARALPESDLTAILDVLVSVGAQAAADELAPALAERLGRRLTRRGALVTTSAGELNAVISVLCRRVHWALGGEPDYPADTPRATVHRMRFADEGQAEDAAAWVTRSGSGSGEVRVGDGSWEVTATYPDLWPGPEHDRHVAELTRVAESYGGEYTGAGY